MKNWKMVCAVLLLVFSFCQEVQAAMQSKKVETVVKADTTKGKKDNVKKDADAKAMASNDVKKPTAYEKLFHDKSCKSVKSTFITIHKIEDKVYFEFPLKYLGKEMLLSSSPSAASNNFVCEIGVKSINHIKFTKDDTLICLRKVNSTTTCTQREEAMEKAVARNNLDPIVASYKILAYNPDSTAVVFDVSGMFLKENDMLPILPGQVGQYSISSRMGRGEPFMTEMKSFDDNLTIKTTMSFSVSLKYYMFTVYQDDVTVVAARSLMLLPEEKMRPRFSDSRVGIFLENKLNVSTEEDQLQSYSVAHRWRVEPKDVKAYGKGKLVEPVKPIVFYLDDAFPESWKKPIKEGTLRWNKAFEKIGFKNVIQVKDYPKDDASFDPDNLKYSCIRYIPSSMENAMGLSFTDPSTGEIMSASILVYNDVVKVINSWRFVQTAQLDPSVRTKKMPDKVIAESIAYVVAHEVGHSLGFMHNMAASAAYPVDSLRSASFTQKYGTTPSIMDYARFNYVAQPGDKGVRLTPPDLGIYDEFLIKWAYQYFPQAKDAVEESKILEKWVDEKAGDPRYRYGRQQIYSRYDPSALEEDLGDDPIKAGNYGIKNLQYILKNIDEWIVNDENGKQKADLYSELTGQYYRYVRNVLYNIGGIYLTSVKEGTPGNIYQSVPREVQKASLVWVMDQFRSCDWLDNEALKKKLPLKINSSVTVRKRIAQVLKKSYEGVILSAHVAKEDPYTVEEFFDDYYKGVFENILTGRTLTEGDKMLQSAALDLLNETLQEKTDKGLFGLTSSLDVYAPSLDDIVAYGLDETGVMEKYAGMFEELSAEPMDLNLKKELSLKQFGHGYGWQHEVNWQAIDNSKVYIYDMALKVKQLLEDTLPSSTGDAKRHYQSLLFTLNRLLK
jgi:hypothetical protein